MPVLRGWLPPAWSLVLALLLLGPALGPGYVLSYDMVWVPDLALRGDFLGLASGLPRAVPSDAVVAVLDGIVPGMLLQKLVLLGALMGGGLGAVRLAPTESLVGRLVAVSAYQWNPFVAERLLIGHWTVLLGYAVLPWVVVLARRWRTTGLLPIPLLVLLPLGSLGASAGLATAVLLVVLAAGRRLRRNVLVLALVLAANAPWLVSGLLHASSATTDATGADAFALNRDGALPGPLAALGLGGIWNAEVVLPSRHGALAWLSLAFVLVLAAAGVRSWVRRQPRREVVGLVACWLIGWGLAALTWAAPDSMSWVVAHVPGAGLLRDGARILALCAPLLVSLMAHGAADLWRRLPALTGPRVLLGASLVVLPVTLLPDAALGLSGRLEPADFPASYARARQVVAESGNSHDGDVLVLPLSSYRQPGWNHRHKVLDPIGRYLTRDYVASDELVVSDAQLAGEDPRVSEAAHALAAPTAQARAAALAQVGIGLVVVDLDAPGDAPDVQGRVLLETAELQVVEVAGAEPRKTPGSWWVAMTLAWALFLGSGALAAVGAAREWGRRRGGRRVSDNSSVRRAR